ncbi:MAG: radical SAM protein [Bacillota bacterium]|nr:radical SAM protein [Bacillota bacterium]
MHLSIMISNKCNYQCSHCIENSSPDQEERISLEKIIELIDSAARISENEEFKVSFTGGEAFLYFEDLKESVRRAKENKATSIGCVTNAYWAASSQEAVRKLREVKNAGIDHIAFSYDEFHRKFVLIDHIKNAFIAANEAGISATFKIVLFKGKERASDFLKKILDITPGTRFSIEELLGLPLGRARNLPKDLFLFTEGIPKGKCHGCGNIMIRYDGNAYACCCPTFSEALLLGNVYRDSLENIYNKVKNGSLFKVLMDKGPIYFVPYLQEAGVVFIDGSFVDQCHLCSEVLKYYNSSELMTCTYNNAIEEWSSDKQKEKITLNIISEFLGI